jgi:hypothetical protein
VNNDAGDGFSLIVLVLVAVGCFLLDGVVTAVAQWLWTRKGSEVKEPVRRRRVQGTQETNDTLRSLMLRHVRGDVQNVF